MLFQIVRSVVKVCFAMKHVLNTVNRPVIVITPRAMAAIPGFITTRATTFVDSALTSPVTKQLGSVTLAVLTGIGEISVVTNACIPTANLVRETMENATFVYRENMEKTVQKTVAVHAQLPAMVKSTARRTPEFVGKDSAAPDGTVPTAPCHARIIAHPLKTEGRTVRLTPVLVPMVVSRVGTETYAIYLVIPTAVMDSAHGPAIV